MEDIKRSEFINIINRFEQVVKKDFSPLKEVHVEVPETKPVQKPVVKKPAENNYSDMSLDELKNAVSSCNKCKLCSTRKNVVFGEGCTVKPLVMVIGEGPGENEDITGRPFVGKAGEYLDQWLKAISLSRTTNTYIANIVKCRPPQNRDPELDEKRACYEYLKAQIRILSPKVILCLGKPASTLMTGIEDAPMGSIRGKFYFYDKSIPMICTYHPAAVLRDLSLKRAVWDDLKKLAQYLNLDLEKKG